MISGAIAALRAATSMGGNSTISHEELVEAHAAGAVTIVDVREPAEYRGGHIAGAINMPLSAFQAPKIPKDKPIIVYCASGARSNMALGMLKQAGFENVRNYRPGFGIWRMQGGACA